MLIDNVSGAFDSRGIDYTGGPGLFESTSTADDQVVTLQRLGGDDVTWVDVGDLATIIGNGVVNFNLDKSQIRLSQASGTNVFGDIKTRRISS